MGEGIATGPDQGDIMFVIGDKRGERPSTGEGFEPVGSAITESVGARGAGPGWPIR
jgi:hypothetical protein